MPPLTGETSRNPGERIHDKEGPAAEQPFGHRSDHQQRKHVRAHVREAGMDECAGNETPPRALCDGRTVAAAPPQQGIGTEAETLRSNNDKHHDIGGDECRRDDDARAPLGECRAQLGPSLHRRIDLRLGQRQLKLRQDRAFARGHDRRIERARAVFAYSRPREVGPATVRTNHAALPFGMRRL